MIEYILHFIAVGLPVSLSSLGVGYAQGCATKEIALQLGRQEAAKTSLVRTLLLGLAFIETGAVLSLVASLSLLIGTKGQITLPYSIAELGIAIAVGGSAAFMSYASGLAAAGALRSIARQPFFAPKITTFMMIMQTLIEAPVIFSFLIGLLITTRLSSSLSLYQAISLCAAGCMMAIVSAGIGIGQSFLSQTACAAIGTCKAAYNKIFTFTLIVSAIVETPLIFSLIVSLFILIKSGSSHLSLTQAFSMLSSALCISLGGAGVGVGSCMVARSGCSALVEQPDAYPSLLQATLLGQVVIETCCIYSLIVSLTLLFQ